MNYEELFIVRKLSIYEKTIVDNTIGSFRKILKLHFVV